MTTATIELTGQQQSFVDDVTDDLHRGRHVSLWDSPNGPHMTRAANGWDATTVTTDWPARVWEAIAHAALAASIHGAAGAYDADGALATARDAARMAADRYCA